MTNAIVPFNEMQQLANSVAKSNLFGIKTPDQALVLMSISQAEGRHPALAARDYDIIQGKPAKKAEAMLRDFLQSGGKVSWHKLDDALADATFSHPQGGEIRISWDMERAKTAGLASKDNWKKHPRQMLRSRVVSEGIRTVCPMATSGLYVPEEVQDFDDKPQRPAPIQMQSAPIIDPPVHPETGEVSPHKISLGILPDGAGTDWVEFGKSYAVALQSAKTPEEFQEWIKLNADAMNTIAADAPKFHARLLAIIDARRLALVPNRDDDLDIPVFLQRPLPEAAE